MNASGTRLIICNILMFIFFCSLFSNKQEVYINQHVFYQPHSTVHAFSSSIFTIYGLIRKDLLYNYLIGQSKSNFLTNLLNNNETLDLPPSIIISKMTLEPFQSLQGIASIDQRYIIEGNHLTNDLEIIAPLNFQISLSGTTNFQSSLHLSPNQGYIPPTTIFVRFKSSFVGLYAGEILHKSKGINSSSVNVSGIALKINLPPNEPVLIQPNEIITSTSDSDILSVYVSDKDSDHLSVSFFGRKTGFIQDFSMILLPDSQVYSALFPEIFTAQTKWISDHKKDLNIVFVMQVGDLVDKDLPYQYMNANAAFNTLDQGNVAYSVIPGNHDHMLFNTYFGVSRYEGKTYYQGHYGETNRNNYSFINIGSIKFIVIGLENNPSIDVINWADSLLKANPDRKAIIFTHNLLDGEGNWTGDIYRYLHNNPNLFLLLCGHNLFESKRVDNTPFGVIYSLMANFQTYNRGGDGYLRILQFKPQEDKISVSTYSPYIDDYKVGSNSNFDLSYSMPDEEDFHLLGTIQDIPSDSKINLSWMNNEGNSGYEWYVVVSDGKTTTKSPVWFFLKNKNLINQYSFNFPK